MEEIKMVTKFSGVMPALITPLNEDETLNAPVVHQLMDSLIAQGASGFYIGGATGEGIALSRQVREHLAEEAISHIKGKKSAIVHVASANFADAVALAKHAEKCGADAISAVPPLFFKYDEDDVYNYYKELAGAVHIPLMVYYSPAANFPISAKFAARLFEVDNITAIKWTSSDYYGMLCLKHMTNGEMNIINGPDEMLLMGLNAGADGGIGTTYNMMFPKIKAVYDSFIAGDREKAHQAQMEVSAIISVLLQYITIPAVKAVLECKGFAVGNAAFPMKRYSEEKKWEIYERLKAAGLE